MKAAVVRAFGEPLVIEERPDPEPGPGQVRVRVEASGLCHTDIHAAHGDWPVKPTPPFVPGHEGVGVVEKLGEGVTHLSVGRRVAVPWLGRACGRCEPIGSIVGTRQDLDEVFRLHAAGRTEVIYETRPLVSVNESIDAVLRGEIKARIVFDLGTGR